MGLRLFLRRMILKITQLLLLCGHYVVGADLLDNHLGDINDDETTTEIVTTELPGRRGGTRAASTLVNCGCQCSSLTFLDSWYNIHGNCQRADQTGALWCYVDSSHYSSCEDLQPSVRFPHNPWSYQACATPQVSSYECQAYGTGGTGSGTGAGYGCRGHSCPGTNQGSCQCTVCPVCNGHTTTTVNPIIRPRGGE